jgi:hypothetical protein
MHCIHCGCTEDRACPGGCHWVSMNPPVCSACEDDDDGAREIAGSFFGAEPCPASDRPAAHAPIWLTETSGYCARCHSGFST